LIRLARSILRDFDLTGNELLQLKAGMIGKVRVGVLPVAAPVLVPQAVIRFAKAAPEIAVSLYEGNSDQLLPLLRDGQLELVVGNLPSASKSIALQLKELLPGEPVVAVCGLRHALANKTEVSAFDLANYPVVIPPSGVIFRDAVAAAMDALGIPIRGGTIESGSMTATNTFVRDTDAISFYSEHLAKHYLRLGMVKILPISTSVLTSPIGVVWSKNIDVSVATQLIIKNLSLVANSLSR
jgi:DNA-binding transcriptional LysR family regulator